MNIPNLLTVLRVLLIPVFILLFYLPFSWSYWAASAVFALAAVTDWFDGYLARRLEQSTPFGAFLDPVADKLMVAVALVLLVEEHSNLWLTLPAAIIIGREIVVSAAGMDGGARGPGSGRGIPVGQMEDRRTDGCTGHPPGQPGGIHALGVTRLRPAVHCCRPDPVVHVPVSAGCLAASAGHPGKEISFFESKA